MLMCGRNQHQTSAPINMHTCNELCAGAQEPHRHHHKISLTCTVYIIKRAILRCTCTTSTQLSSRQMYCTASTIIDPSQTPPPPTTTTYHHHTHAPIDLPLCSLIRVQYTSIHVDLFIQINLSLFPISTREQGDPEYISLNISAHSTLTPADAQPL